MITINAIQWPEKWIPGEAIQLPFLSKAQELYSQAEKSGLGALDMAAVYHYLEKGEH
ncbi:hypothetical protein KVC76_03385 [Helicobacter pylori]|nr:hypothetical protein KVC76_03385 [Helicobacter pylori]